MSEEATEAKRITLWAMRQYGLTNGDHLYNEIYAALQNARQRGAADDREAQSLHEAQRE